MRVQSSGWKGGAKRSWFGGRVCVCGYIGRRESERKAEGDTTNAGCINDVHTRDIDNRSGREHYYDGAKFSTSWMPSWKPGNPVMGN